VSIFFRIMEEAKSVKIYFKGTVRRYGACDVQSADWTAFATQLRSVLGHPLGGLETPHGGRYRVTYVDTDGDEVTLRSIPELHEAARQSDGVLRLHVTRNEPRAEAPPKAEVEAESVGVALPSVDCPMQPRSIKVEEPEMEEEEPSTSIPVDPFTASLGNVSVEASMIVDTSTGTDTDGDDTMTDYGHITQDPPRLAAIEAAFARRLAHQSRKSNRKLEKLKAKANAKIAKANAKVAKANAKLDRLRLIVPSGG